MKDPEDFYNCLEANVDEIVGYYLPDIDSVATEWMIKVQFGILPCFKKDQVVEEFLETIEEFGSCEVEKEIAP